MNTIKNECFNSLLMWMNKNFDGDMNSVVGKAITYVEENKLASGPLWDELGERVLRVFFQERLRTQRRVIPESEDTFVVNNQGNISSDSSIKQEGRGTTRNMDSQSGFEPLQPSIFLTWCCVGKEWIQLGEMTKEQCLAKAYEYEESAKADLKEAEYFKSLASRMKENQLVKEAFSEQEIVGLRAA